MAEYINIKGQNIEVVASDPANPTLGQIWYNSTSNTLKGGGVTTAGAWATGNNMNTATLYSGAGAGTQTAALMFGGVGPGGNSNVTYEYNGTSWTPGNNLNRTTQQLAGGGTQTAGLAFGGEPLSAATEEYDGTNWTTVNPMNTGRYSLGAAGTQTAGLAFSGLTPPLQEQQKNMMEIVGQLLIL
jgi:hypothetical protein